MIHLWQYNAASVDELCPGEGRWKQQPPAYYLSCSHAWGFFFHATEQLLELLAPKKPAACYFCFPALLDDTHGEELGKEHLSPLSSALFPTFLLLFVCRFHH